MDRTREEDEIYERLSKVYLYCTAMSRILEELDVTPDPKMDHVLAQIEQFIAEYKKKYGSMV